MNFSNIARNITQNKSADEGNTNAFIKPTICDLKNDVLDSKEHKLTILL